MPPELKFSTSRRSTDGVSAPEEFGTKAGAQSNNISVSKPAFAVGVINARADFVKRLYSVALGFAAGTAFVRAGAITPQHEFVVYYDYIVIAVTLFLVISSWDCYNISFEYKSTTTFFAFCIDTVVVMLQVLMFYYAPLKQAWIVCFLGVMSLQAVSSFIWSRKIILSKGRGGRSFIRSVNLARIRKVHKLYYLLLLKSVLCKADKRIHVIKDLGIDLQIALVAVICIIISYLTGVQTLFGYTIIVIVSCVVWRSARVDSRLGEYRVPVGLALIALYAIIVDAESHGWDIAQWVCNVLSSLIA